MWRSFGKSFLTIALALLAGWSLRGVADNNVQRGMIRSESIASRSPKEPVQHRRPRKVFIDLGVNCGNSYYRFKDGKEESSDTTLSTTDWEAYLWECNPQLINWYLNDLIEKETAQGLNVTLIPKAASTEDGTISFFLTEGQGLDITKDKVRNPKCDPDSKYNPSGASTIYGNAGRAGEKVEVPAVDFLAWFKKLELKAGDIVHMKMDIEGAEVDILEAFLADETNQICTWSQFWSEWHAFIFPVDSPDYVKHKQFQKSFDSRFEKKCGRIIKPGGILK